MNRCARRAFRGVERFPRSDVWRPTRSSRRRIRQTEPRQSSRLRDRARARVPTHLRAPRRHATRPREEPVRRRKATERRSGGEQPRDLLAVGAEHEERPHQHLDARVRLLEARDARLGRAHPPGEIPLCDALRPPPLANPLGQPNSHLDDGRLLVRQAEEVLNGSLRAALRRLLLPAVGRSRASVARVAP